MFVSIDLFLFASKFSLRTFLVDVLTEENLLAVKYFKNEHGKSEERE